METTTINRDIVRYTSDRYSKSQLEREILRSKLSLEHFRNDVKMVEALKFKIELYEMALTYARDNTPHYSLSAEALKSKVDIVEYVGKFTHLWRSGKNYTGRCPLHGERHASLFVYPERQDWYCFGCLAGGDIFNFVQRFHDVNFYDSLKILSDEVLGGN